MVDAAQAGSRALTATTLAASPHLSQITELSVHSERQWASDLRASRQRINEQVESDEVPELDAFAYEPQKSYQAKISALLYKTRSEDRDHRLAAFQRARVDSIKARGALSWLSTLPMSTSLQLSAPQFRAALCYNLGIAQPCLRDVKRCSNKGSRRGRHRPPFHQPWVRYRLRWG